MSLTSDKRFGRKEKVNIFLRYSRYCSYDIKLPPILELCIGVPILEPRNIKLRIMWWSGSKSRFI